ncbi:MAG: hypothetical protein ACNS60_19020 [Candidatus Cyclobacteriaceae bacterium M2_1C_046]
MKKLFLLGLLTISCIISNAQSPKLAETEIIYFGIDFSEAKLIGSDGFTDPDRIQSHFFDEWNELMLNEPEKYDIKGLYRRDKVHHDLSVVEERNDTPEPDDLVINSSYSFEEGQLERIISNYDSEEYNEGLGLVYVVETLNKTAEHAKINVVFFDVSTKEILWNKEYTVAPGGFGFRNFWARAFYNVMKESGKDYYKAVKKL